MTTYEARISEHPTHETVKGYWQRHETAMAAEGASVTRGHERAVALMLRGWLAYADAHPKAFESGVGDDYYCGPEWETIGQALLRLLSGPIGRIDCGAADSLLRTVMIAEGFTGEQ